MDKPLLVLLFFHWFFLRAIFQILLITQYLALLLFIFSLFVRYQVLLTIEMSTKDATEADQNGVERKIRRVIKTEKSIGTVVGSNQSGVSIPPPASIKQNPPIVRVSKLNQSQNKHLLSEHWLNTRRVKLLIVTRGKILNFTKAYATNCARLCSTSICQKWEV